MKRFLVLLAMLMTGTAHAGVIVGTAYCTGIQVTDCALAGGVLTDVNGSCVCDTSPPAPPPSDDEREIVPSPTTFPWYTAVKVDIGPTGGGRGSAMLISDCTMLTVGHAVFAPDTGTWLNIAAVHPGHYYNNATNTGIDPFGSKTPLTTATNTKWVDGKGSDYDYGAIFLASSFRSAGITTFIPLAFEDEPDYINSAGYPSEGLPSSVAGATQEQWWAYGWVNDYTSRRMYYDATSTGGASGAGVWVFYGDTSERYLVGINQAHNVTSDGIGTRLVSQNEDVIVGWMARGCPNGGLPALPWPVLRDTLHALDGTPITVRSAAQLNLVPPQAPVGPPARSIAQVIEGTLYRWQEFQPEGPGTGDDREVLSDNRPGLGGRPPQRFLKMLAPVNKVLTTQEARILLSASLLWQRRPNPQAGMTIANGPAAVKPVVQGNVPQTTDEHLASQNDQSVSHP